MTTVEATPAAPAARALPRARPAPRSPWRRASSAVLAIGASVPIALYLYVALRRFTHPYELEWMEGGVVDQVRRVLEGHPIYAAPSLRTTTYLYPPLYTYLGAAASWVVGPGYAPLRAISILASIGLGAAMYALVRTETRDRVAALAGVGLFFGCYRIAGAWLDIARVDTLFLALTFAGLLVLRRTRTPWHAAGAAALLVLAAFTKQYALFPAVAAIPWSFRLGRRTGITYTAVLVGLLALGVAAMQVVSDGWFLFYTWTVPRSHPVIDYFVVRFWTDDLLGHVAIAIALAGVATVALLRWYPRRIAWFYLPVCAALVFASYPARLHSGGYANVLLSAYAGIAVLAALGVAAMRRSRRTVWSVLATALVLAQLVAVAYSPNDQIPPASDVAATKRLIAELRTLPGPVFLSGHGWLLARAGRDGDSTSQTAALADILRADYGEPTRRLGVELDDAIRNQRFCTVVVDDLRQFTVLPPDFERYYERTGTLIEGRALRPVTDIDVAPGEIWSPRDPAPGRCGS